MNHECISSKNFKDFDKEALEKIIQELRKTIFETCLNKNPNKICIPCLMADVRDAQQVLAKLDNEN